MELKATLKDYTAAEFQALVDKIWAVDLPKQDHDRLINHFDRIVGHPQGADLLFYPDDRFGSNNAAWVVYLVRYWHQKQGIAAFKGESSSLPPPPIPISAVARGFAEVQKIAEDVAVSDQAIDRAFEAFAQGGRYLRGLQGVHLDISAQEANIRTLERAQRETLIAMRKFEFLKMRIEFAKNDAQRNLTYARSEQAQWQSIARQINATHSQYLTRLTAITQRHRVVHDDAEALLDMAQEQLIRSRNLAKAGPAHAACMINGALNFVDKRPAVLLQGEPSALELSQRVDLQKSIRSAVTEFTWQSTSGTPLSTDRCAPVLYFGFSSRADTQIYGLSTPLSELIPIEGMNWQILAQNRADVDLPFRMSSAIVTATPGAPLLGIEGIKSMSQVYVAASKAGNSALKVRVRMAHQDQDANSFSFTADGAAPITISWSSASVVENGEPKSWPQSSPLTSVQSPPVPALEPLSSSEGVHFDDYIVVFPVESGLNPVYVMFRGRHEYPV